MVGLVIEHHDVFHAHEIGHDPLEHLALGFDGIQLVARPALEQRAAAG